MPVDKEKTQQNATTSLTKKKTAITMAAYQVII